MGGDFLGQDGGAGDGIPGTRLHRVAGARSGFRYEAEWDSVDVGSPEEWRVEVKSSTYLQTWAQAKPSNISFSVASGWDAETGEYSPEGLRRSDAYVFCVLHHQDKQSLDPLDLGQWEF